MITSTPLAMWLLLAFWLIVVAVLGCIVWFYRNYPKQQALIARTDEQHAALMRGDLHLGTYGTYPPADLS